MPGRKPRSGASEKSPLTFIPEMVCFAAGVGQHQRQRVAMHRALTQCGVGDLNLVKVSSVIPPACRVVERRSVRAYLQPGSVVFAVIAKGETSEPHQRVGVAVVWAQPDDPDQPGMITEVEEELAMGKTDRTAVAEAGQAMLDAWADGLGAKPPRWNGRSKSYEIGTARLKVGWVSATATGPEGGGYATAVAVAVFV